MRSLLCPRPLLSVEEISMDTQVRMGPQEAATPDRDTVVSEMSSWHWFKLYHCYFPLIYPSSAGYYPDRKRLSPLLHIFETGDHILLGLLFPKLKKKALWNCGDSGLPTGNGADDCWLTEQKRSRSRSSDSFKEKRESLERTPRN